jgi:chromatin licensing and DNA replication factor 1
MIGRYGKKLNDYELHVKVNLNYQRETQELLGGDPADLAVITSGKLAPTAKLERQNILHNSLVNLVREHNAAHCARLGLQVDSARITKVHPSFDLDSCPAVPATELPAKPQLQEYMSAKAMLEQARDLFEAAPRVSAVLEEVAGKVAEEQPVVPPVEKPKAVPKALASVPTSLLERIRAKEAEKKAKEMYQDKGEEIRMKRLKRLPDIARIIKSIFISESRNALKRPFLVQKLYQV